MTLDARATLDSILLDGVPDADQFVDDRREDDPRRARGRHPRACVRRDGRPALGARRRLRRPRARGAVERPPGRDHDFELLCAYPTSALGDARLGDVSEVCAAALAACSRPPSYATGTPAADATIAEYSQVFLPVPEAVAAVRRFVTEVLTPLAASTTW